MDWVVIVGVLCLGAIIGGLVCHYVAKLKRFQLRELSSAISILGGAGVIAIFHFLHPEGSTREYWFYPVGLLLGFIVLASMHTEDDEDDKPAIVNP